MKAIVIPADLDKPMVEVEGDDIRKIARAHTNIYWPERVNTPSLAVNNLVMAVDDEGHDKRFHLNPRAVALSEYPGSIVGDAIILGEKMGDDGIDFIDVPPGALALLDTLDVQHRGERLRDRLVEMGRML